MTYGFTIIDSLPDFMNFLLESVGFTDTQLFDLAVQLYESCQGRKDTLNGRSLFFPFGKDVVVASYLQQLECDTSESTDSVAAATADTENENACERATKLLQYLEKQKRVDKSGPFGTKDEQCAGDIQPGMDGLRQVVIAWAFGSPSPLDIRVVEEARPYIRENNEVSCNKLLSKLSAGKPGLSPKFALTLLGKCGLTKPLFFRRFKAVHEQMASNLYRAMYHVGIFGPKFFESDSDIVRTLHAFTNGISPCLYYATHFEELILKD